MTIDERSHQLSDYVEQINKTADRMYALFAICNSLSPSKLDDNIINTVKERFGEQVTKMSRGTLYVFRLHPFRNF